MHQGLLYGKNTFLGEVTFNASYIAMIATWIWLFPIWIKSCQLNAVFQRGIKASKSNFDFKLATLCGYKNTKNIIDNCNQKWNQNSWLRLKHYLKLVFKVSHKQKKSKIKKNKNNHPIPPPSTSSTFSLLIYGLWNI